MHTAYHPELTADTQQLLLSSEESHHAVKVLRLQNGDTLLLANGKGGKAVGTIAEAHAKKCLLTISGWQFESTPKHLVHVALATTKNIDRLLWFVEKSTELGISRISLLHCRNNERKNVNLEKLEKTALAAMKQSQRYYLPQIDDMVSLTAFVKSHPKGCIAHCEEGSERRFLGSTQAEGPLLIGPEGDFQASEIEFALKAGYVPVDLGPNRLRTETAALYGTMLLLQD